MTGDIGHCDSMTMICPKSVTMSRSRESQGRRDISIKHALRLDMSLWMPRCGYQTPSVASHLMFDYFVADHVTGRLNVLVLLDQTI